jgi:endonuclease III related protein
MTSTGQRLLTIFNVLLNQLGKRHWWPGDSPLEVAIGAILTQNTSWKNVERAMERLKEAGLVDALKIVAAGVDHLGGVIRPAGFFNIKAKRLKAFAQYLSDGYGGSMERLKEGHAEQLRRELLGINGVGQETADSILLYALEKPVFVVDAYTRRFMKSHGLSDGNPSYGDMQAYFMDNLPVDIYLFNEFHALIVRLCQLYCVKVPRCVVCPLEADLSCDLK